MRDLAALVLPDTRCVPKEIEMVNLEDLEKRLNSDANLRDRFFADPVGVLRTHGLLLSPQQERAVRDAVFKLRTTGQHVPGASVGGGLTLVLMPAVQ